MESIEFGPSVAGTGSTVEDDQTKVADGRSGRSGRPRVARAALVKRRGVRVGSQAGTRRDPTEQIQTARARYGSAIDRFGLDRATDDRGAVRATRGGGLDVRCSCTRRLCGSTLLPEIQVVNPASLSI
jgi:hypothetical protein